MQTYFITGATSGLGHQVALRLARQGGHRLILPVRNIARGAAVREALLASGAGGVLTPVMDLASLHSVAAFVRAFNSGFDGQLDGVLLNAGVQSAGQMLFTCDGLEATFAVNHLAHHLLLEGMRGHLADAARVGWVASGTHDPAEPVARLSGFRGARYTSAMRLAKGEREPGVSIGQACRDAYATSKLCNIVSAREWAQGYSCDEAPASACTFFSFDPGLMAGTGLARQQGPLARWAWRHVLPWVAAVLPGTSTPERSAEVLAGLLSGQQQVAHNGAYFDHTGRPRSPAAPACEPRLARDLMDTSRLLLAPFVPVGLEGAQKKA